MVTNLPTMEETRIRSLGQEDPLEKEMAIHSSILAWEIPWTEEPGWATGCSPKDGKELNMTEQLTLSQSSNYGTEKKCSYFKMQRLSKENQSFL